MSTQPMIRVEVRAYSASFRVPGMMGYQLTSPVPPPSTVYGLLAAACGREVTPEEASIAYHFDYDVLAEDVEKIIFFTEQGPKWSAKTGGVGSGVVTREFLANPRLTLYLPAGEAANALLRPRFPILLGRSQDVAYVASWREAMLESVEQAEVSGVLLPFPIRSAQMRSRLLSFPTFHTVQEPRRARAVKPFHILDALAGKQMVGAPDLWRDVQTGEAMPLFHSGNLS